MFQSGHLIDLDELILLCGSSEGKPYIVEAVSCYKVGSFRACILTTWIGVVFDFIGKLRQLAMSGEPEAERKIKHLETLLQNNNVTELLKFERNVLLECKDTYEFITQLEYEDLRRLADDRDRCAHPAMRSIDEPYYPTAESARYHLRNAVNYMIQHPPAHGKAFVDKLIDQVESDYFPDDARKAIAFFESTPLARPRISLLRNFIIVILKRMIPAAYDDLLLLFRYISALEAISEMHRADVQQILEANVSQIFMSDRESDYGRLITILFYMPDLWIHIKDDLKLKLSEFVKYLPDSEKEHILWIVFQSDLFLQSAQILSLNLTGEDLNSILSKYASANEALPDCIVDRMVSLYTESVSFAQANYRATTWIIPSINSLRRVHVENVLAAALENGQILDSFEFESLLRAISELSKEYYTLVSDWFARNGEYHHRISILKEAIFPDDIIPF